MLPRGVPENLALDAELSLALFVPTGDAMLWRNGAADASVVAADDENTPVASPATEDPIARAMPRLVLRRARQNIGVVPLVAGLARRLPDDGASPAVIELRILDFALNVSAMRNAGDGSSFVELAWRRVDRGTSRFSLPPIDPRVAERFAGVFKSQVGGDDSAGSP